MQYLTGQSLEVMVGHERIFTDIQWFKPVDADRRVSVFSRTRATVDYNNNTNLFTGAYLNYTLHTGVGASVIGKAGAAGAGVDAGIHFLKITPAFTTFVLVSAGLKNRLEYSWFSISRYTPKISDKCKLYTSLELFSLFQPGDHLASVQRIRVGLRISQTEFGAAANLSETGNKWLTSENFGGFVRRSF